MCFEEHSVLRRTEGVAQKVIIACYVELQINVSAEYQESGTFEELLTKQFMGECQTCRAAITEVSHSMSEVSELSDAACYDARL